MKTKLVMLTFVLVAVLVLLVPAASATGTTGTWVIKTYSGKEPTASFSYPDVVNATIYPWNISVSGQRTVTIASAENVSLTYFSSSIGFYPVGINGTTGRVNVSWPIPASLQGGGAVVLSVGLSGVKTPETTVTLTIRQNFTNAVNQIIAPIISGFQGQVNYLQQKLDGVNAALADSDFRHNQIEAVLGIGLACCAVYIVYDKRKRADRKEEVQKSAQVFDHWAINVAQENAEPGERPAVRAAAENPAASAAAAAKEA